MRSSLSVQDARPETAGAAPPVCLNCRERLLGDFCWRCGQEAVDLARPLRQMASDYLDDVLSLDTRLLRTIGPLLFRPGRLTREYLAGRRAPYVRPFRLYLLAALVCFGVMAIWPLAALNLVFRASDQPAESTAAKPVSAQAESLSPWLQQGLEKALADQERFGEAFAANLPRAFFLLLPIFALLLTLFYRRQGYRYLDHLVFALHFHAFAFAIMPVRIVIAAARLPPQIDVPFRMALSLWILGYLLLALRRVYGGSWWATGLQFLALLTSYGIVFLLALLGLMLITLYLF